MRRSLVPFCLALLLLLVSGRPAPAVEIGDTAPELQVTEWIQNGPVKFADGRDKTVWLLVLWGTFEADCLDAMPEVNKLYGKLKDKGLDVVALSSEPAELVKAFLDNHKVDFRVAVDVQGKTSAAYAKKVPKLPWSFIVDKTGTVVWQGDPTNGIESLLTDVIAGKFDHKKAKDLATSHQALFDALWRGEWDKVAELADKILEIDPKDGTAFSFRLWAFENKKDQEGFKKFMKAHIERCKDDADALQNAASRLAFEGNWEWRDIDLALTTIRRAVEVSKSGDADVLQTYAQVLVTTGQLEQAIEQQKKAVAIDAKDEDAKKVLGYFEACLAARKKASAPATPPKKK